jgi:hypothetical protein
VWKKALVEATNIASSGNTIIEETLETHPTEAGI